MPTAIERLLREFREFAVRGSVVDLAVGVIVGAAFGKIASSLVNDVLMPPLGLVIGRVDFSSLFISLSGRHYESLAEAKAAGAATLNYGLFINQVLDFLIVAFAVFLVVRQFNRLRRRHDQEGGPTTKPCPFCASTIPLKASRCPQCTSHLDQSA